jgi:diacylglycerol kinase (ATP)
MIAPARTLLVVNPAAGHGRGKRTFKRLEARLRSAFPGLEIRTSERPGQAVEIGRQAARDRTERILCLGGDGTPFEVVNGLYAEGRPVPRPEIGIIPAGTGNSFIRDFGLTGPGEALDRILSGQRRAVDALEFEFHRGGGPVRMISLNIIGVGLIADILRLTNEKLKPLGSLGYSVAVLMRLARGMDNRIDIETDGRRSSIRNSALVVCNSKFTGGKMKIAPSADTSDGRADLVVFRSVNRREILSIFARVFSGKHTGHPKVENIQAVEISIEAAPAQLVMADGELLGTTPLRLKVLPAELTVLA